MEEQLAIFPIEEYYVREKLSPLFDRASMIDCVTSLLEKKVHGYRKGKLEPEILRVSEISWVCFS